MPSKTSKTTARRHSPIQLMGMNIAGAEFSDSMPGQHNHHYTWPRAANFERYVALGIQLIRLPFRWERVQHQLYGELDDDEMQRFMAALDGAHAAGMQVLLDMHNYYERKIDDHHYVEIGTAEAPVEAWIDGWLRVVARVKDHPAVWGYGLMNEPKGTEGRWAAGAQRCVDAVRAVDPHMPIIIAGDGFSTAQFWEDQNGAYFPLRGDNLLYEAHIYLDRDTSGRYDDLDEDIHPNKGIARAVPFFNWLKAHGQRGFLGELGVPEFMPKAVRAMDRLLGYAVRNQIPVFYWAGGSQWNEGHETACEYDGRLLGQTETVARHLSLADRIGPIDTDQDELPSLEPEGPEEPGPIDPELPPPAQPLKAASQWNPIFSAADVADSGAARTQYAFCFPFRVGGGDVAELLLSMANWFLPPDSLVGEGTQTLLPFTALALEFNGVVQPVRFAGAGEITLWDGAGDVQSDPLPASLFGVAQFANGAEGWVKGVIALNGAGKRVPYSSLAVDDDARSHFSISDPEVTTLSPVHEPGPFSHQGVSPVSRVHGYRPMLLGRHVGADSRALFVRGEAQGLAQWFQRALSGASGAPAAINFAVPDAKVPCGLDEHRLSALLAYCPDGGGVCFALAEGCDNPPAAAEALFERVLEHAAQARAAKVVGPIAVGCLLPARPL